MRENRAPYWRERRLVGAINGRSGESLDRPDEPPLIGAATTSRAARPPRFFTVHLGFEAHGSEQARDRAVGYAEALALLRPELALGAAALSPADAWHRAERLFCGVVGPDDERCAYVAGHPGFHHAPGPGGLGWGDG
jgi:hypothetical protein